MFDGQNRYSEKWTTVDFFVSLHFSTVKAVEAVRTTDQLFSSVLSIYLSI